MDKLFDTVTGNLLSREEESVVSKPENNEDEDKDKIADDEEKNVLIQDKEDYIQSFAQESEEEEDPMDHDYWVNEII